MDEQLTPEEARVRAIFGSEVTVKPIHEPEPEDSDAESVDIITRICYFYPQYTLETAEKLTDSQTTALLIQAEKQRAINLYNLTLIAAAPHTKKGKMVDKLIKQYRKIIDI